MERVVTKTRRLEIACWSPAGIANALVDGVAGSAEVGTAEWLGVELADGELGAVLTDCVGGSDEAVPVVGAAHPATVAPVISTTLKTTVPRATLGRLVSMSISSNQHTWDAAQHDTVPRIHHCDARAPPTRAIARFAASVRV